jgi:hypothetical protein
VGSYPVGTFGCAAGRAAACSWRYRLVGRGVQSVAVGSKPSGGGLPCLSGGQGAGFNRRGWSLSSQPGGFPAGSCGAGWENPSVRRALATTSGSPRASRIPPPFRCQVRGGQVGQHHGVAESYGEPCIPTGVCLVGNDRNALAATFERECSGAIRREGKRGTKCLKRVVRSGPATALESEGVLIPIPTLGLTRTEAFSGASRRPVRQLLSGPPRGRGGALRG